MATLHAQNDHAGFRRLHTLVYDGNQEGLTQDDQARASQNQERAIVPWGYFDPSLMSIVSEPTHKAALGYQEIFRDTCGPCKHKNPKQYWYCCKHCMGCEHCVAEDMFHRPTRNGPPRCTACHQPGIKTTPERNCALEKNMEKIAKNNAEMMNALVRDAEREKAEKEAASAALRRALTARKGGYKRKSDYPEGVWDAKKKQRAANKRLKEENNLKVKEHAVLTRMVAFYEEWMRANHYDVEELRQEFAHAEAMAQEAMAAGGELEEEGSEAEEME